MFGLEYTRVQVLVQLLGKQRYVNTPHKKNRSGVTIQQLKLMAKKSQGRGGGWSSIHSRTVRDPAKAAPMMGEVEKDAEGNHPVKVKECPVGSETSYTALPVAE